MTHACCPDCRLRVTIAPLADAEPCPGCRQPLVMTSAAESIGYPLANGPLLVLPAELAAAMALPVPPTVQP